MIIPSRRHLGRLQTPLVRLERFDPGFLTPRIWIKRDDLTGCGVSGNKVRKLEFCLAEALDKGCDTLIACGGVQSNLCRAVALLGAELGLKVHLVLRGEGTEPRTGNLFLDYLSGARITYVGADDYRSRIWPIMNAIADDYAKAGHKAYAMGPGASNEMGMWGYIVASEELKSDFAAAGITPGYVILPTGTTSTQSGLVLGSRLYDLAYKVVGISVGGSGTTLETKVQKDLVRWRDRFSPTQNVDGLHVQILDGYAVPGYGKADAHIFSLIADVARATGILLDPVYTAKGFHGMLTEAKRGRFSDAQDIVFVHTGGVFGLMAQSQNFIFSD